MEFLFTGDRNRPLLFMVQGLLRTRKNNTLLVKCHIAIPTMYICVHPETNKISDIPERQKHLSDDYVVFFFIWGFPEIGGTQIGWCFMENPI